jgi:Ca2+-binding RTX toxin-like protein
MKRIIPALALAATLAVPAAADAATLKYEGPEGSEVLVLVAADGEKSNMSVQDHTVDGAVTLYDYGTTFNLETPYCKVNYSSVVCPAPNGMRLELGDQDDRVTVLGDVEEKVKMLGGPGNDWLETNDNADVLEGQAGDDRLVASGGDDVLDGGEGNDTLEGASGNDRVLGGPGDDALRPDGYETQGRDVVDGGPGVDEITSDWSTRLLGDPEPLLAVTLGGGADDGRPGEGDDVSGVERLVMSKGGRFVGTDAGEYVKLHQVGDDGELIGNGGDDELRGGDGTDKIDGGTGADKLDGGFGDDTITGGPGRDAISADLAGGDCGPLWCKHPFGNDTVEARDGEADSIACGEGADRVVADAVDTVASDCERVERPIVPVVPPKPHVGPQPVKPTSACARVKVRGLTVKSARKRLARARCAKSMRVRRVADRRVRRGRAIKVQTVRGRTVLVVSRGRR